MTKPQALSLADLRGKKKPVTRSVEIFLDSDVATEINRAQTRLNDLEERLSQSPQRRDLQIKRDHAEAELERLQAEAAETGAVATFFFRAIGRKAYEKLIEEHPATEEQQREARERGANAGLAPQLARLHWNADTFPPALIAAASYEPKISHEEAWEIFHVSEDWNEGELTTLFVTARSAQEGRDVADLGKSRNGSRPTLD